MDIYKVGGAVRDRLLGLPVKDTDWVVVGATVDEMLASGYRQVGKDFPVFLHPDSAEEYALARTERKQGRGYTGFQVHASPDITLEEDLERRDLTINAMAEDEQGNLIDPFDGRRDLESRLLRHVSPAFEEDPLRVLRVARFAARFRPLGFSIADETLTLMRRLSNSGELDHLIAERVWQETARALQEDSPQTFFRILRDCEALPVLFPELHALFGVPQSPEAPPEIDTGEHTLKVLEQSVTLSDSLSVRFATLCHDLGKAMTPRQHWPRHPDHEKAGLQPLNDLCDRLRVPNDCRHLARLVMLYHDQCHAALKADAETLLTLLEHCDAFRQSEERLDNFLKACEAVYRGRSGFKDSPYPQREHLQRALALCRQVAPREIVADGFRGEAVGRELHARRRQALEVWLEEQDPSASE